MDKSKISRVQFTEITKEGVEAGLNDRKEIDEDLVKAATTRRIVDRLFGYKVSPVLWSTLQKNMKFVQGRLSAGRVQSSALKIIIERERLRQSFNSALYFDLKAKLSSGSVPFNASLVKIDNKRIASGKDFDPDTGKLKNDNVYLLAKSEAEQLVSKLNAGMWKISDLSLIHI